MIRYIRIFSELSNQVKYATQKRVLIEVACIKLCKPEMEVNYDSILDRLRTLETQVSNGTFVHEVASEKKQSAEKAQGSKELTEKEQKELLEALPEELVEVAKNWSRIISGLSGPIKSMLLNAIPTPGVGNELILAFYEEVDKSYVEKEEHLQLVQHAISKQINKQIVVKTKLVSQHQENKDKLPDLSKLIKIKEIEIV